MQAGRAIHQINLAMRTPKLPGKRNCPPSVVLMPKENSLYGQGAPKAKFLLPNNLIKQLWDRRMSDRPKHDDLRDDCEDSLARIEAVPSKKGMNSAQKVSAD